MTIAGAVLSVGGMAANSIASGQVEAATNRAVEAERNRQAQLRREAAAVQEQSRQRYDNHAGQQDQRAQELGSYLQSQQTQPPAADAPAEASIAPTSSGIVTQEDARQRAKASAYSQGQAQALGTMRSFGDLLGEQSRLQGRDAGEIGQIGGFMKGSSAVLPLELDAAGQVGNGLKTLGGLASGLGNLGISAGLSGGLGTLLGAGGAKTAGAAAALPTMAATSTASAPTIAGVAAATPTVPMTLGSAFGGLPSFARAGNFYRAF
ncbi:hypothetical protein [Methylorubrum zatmanii]